MRKFVIIPIFVILCAVTIYYTASVYFQIKTTQNTIYSELQKTFFTQANTLIQIFSEREAQANALAKITDPDQLKKAVIGNILAISVFDPHMHFLYGWTQDATQPLSNSLPENYDYHKPKWINININSSYHICYGTYIIQREDNSFLSIRFHLIKVLETVESMNIGSESFATADHISGTQTITSQNSTFSRIKNTPIYFSKQITPEWTFTFKGVWSDIYPFSLCDLYSLLILLTLWGFVLTLGTAILFKADLAHPKALWATSIVFDLFCITAIIVLFLDFPTKFHKIAEESLSFKKTTELFQKSPSATFVPTTIYLESISFPSESCFLITGFIVQSYPKNTSIEKGFIFPESTTFVSPLITKIDQWEEENHIAILWQIEVALAGSFRPIFFPFDTRKLNIVLWPIESKETVIFIPHFSKYPSLFPVDKPGIGTHVDVMGWKIQRSGFLIDTVPPYEFLHSSQSISFNFSVLLARNFLSAFLSNFLSLILCVVVSFLVLFIPQRSVLESLFATISLFIGILFIVVTSHAALRDVLSISSFAYIEYVFVSFYIVLLSLSTYFIFTLKNAEQKAETRFILALLYWPILLGSFTLILMSAFFLT